MTANADPAVRKLELLEQSLAEAELHSDVHFLSGLLADSFVAVGPRGFLLNKAQWMERYSSGSLRNEAFTWDEASYRLLGDPAIAIGRQMQRSQHQGHDASGAFRVTHIFIRQSSAWRLVGAHLSALGAPV